MSLKSKVLFITGASRGIGKEIALKAAKDGAYIAIVSKTAVKHPTLPGTIYETAKEVEACGGKALPLQVDIRDETQIREAVKKTIETFGRINILINNASSIYLSNTLNTTPKHFDLMHSINARGPFICCQACYPFLKKESNPHILNISPPLNMNPQWFKDYLAYSLSKYTLSMFVPGLSAEFAADGIAVNALWPKTLINTSALSGLFKSATLVDEIRRHTRLPSIMADAAYCILEKPSKTTTGNFFIDEKVLQAQGITNFASYANTPGVILQPDYYLD